ncbi:regulatory protein [Sphingobium sp. B8D3D]|nr:regulatory protein [Sphingobium sp. B8D3D]MCW2415327.1 regulatory protein [Sphingobium sp. B8D3A]
MAQKWRMTPRPQKSPPKPLVEASLEALALHYVGRFATSRGRLAAYLARKLRERGWAGDSPPPTERITQKLVDLGYVDDRAYAEMKSGAMQRRGLGQRRIAQTLRHDGIDETTSEQAAPDAAAQWDAAERLARRKRIGPFAVEPADRPLREKQIATFLRAGHSMQTARNWIESAPGELPERPETLSAEDWE